LSRRRTADGLVVGGLRSPLPVLSSAALLLPEAMAAASPRPTLKHWPGRASYLTKRGCNHIVFLGSCINHPVDLGHQVFFEGLRAAFEQ